MDRPVGIQQSEIDKLARELGVTAERIAEAAKVAIYGQAIALAELINRKGMCPVDTGRLRASLYVTLPGRNGDRVECQVGYGASYAADVHERKIATVSQGGYKRARDGTSGWMRKAVNIHARALGIRIRESMRSAVANGLRVESLQAAGIPTSPQDVGEMTKYQRRRGFTREQARALRGLKKNQGVRFVRRWSRPKKKKGG